MKSVQTIVLSLILTCVLSFVTGLIVWFLWNASIPDIFPGVRDITYFQAVILSVLTSILFKSSVSIEKKK